MNNNIFSLKTQPIVTQANITYRTCTSCGQTKSLNDFHNKNGGKYGKNSRCASCIKVVNHTRSKLRSPIAITPTKTKTKTPIITPTSKLANMNVTKTTMFDPFNINQILDAHTDSSLKSSYVELLKHTLGSPTSYFAKEEMVSAVLDLYHCKDINGPDAYDDNAAPWEIKTNSVTMSSDNKATFGGTFNDITEHKLLEIAKYKMAVGVFVDHYLLAIATFPGSWPPFYNRLERELRKKTKGRVCSSFHYNDWKDCPDMQWDVTPDPKSLDKFKNKLSKAMFDDIQEAQALAMEKDKAFRTSRSPYVNIKY